MSQIKKTSFKLNLNSYSVYITDTEPTSKYFLVKDVPESLISGKNYFLIAGTTLLRPGSPVSIEVLDSNGNTIYCEVGDALIDGIYRIISIIAYPDTPIGIASITILGEAKDVPAQWKDKYNVKWQLTLPVDIMTGDTNHPIFKYTPKFYFKEIYDENRKLDLIDEVHIISKSVNDDGMRGTAYGNISRDAPYYLIWNSGSFTSDMVGGIVNIPTPASSVYSSNYIAQITQVINCSTARVSPSYLYSSTYRNKSIDANSLAFKPIDFANSGFILKYTDKMQNVGSVNKRISYLNVHAVDLDTYTGVLKYVNLYKQPGNVFIGKYPVIPHDMIDSGSVFNNLGDFTTNWEVQGQNQWYVECVTDMYSSSLHIPTPIQYSASKAVFNIKNTSAGNAMSGYMNGSGYSYPTASSLTVYSSSSPSYLFFGGSDTDYENILTWYKTYLYCASASIQSMSLSCEDGISIYVNGYGQYSQSSAIYSSSLTMSFRQGLNQFEMFVQNIAGPTYVWLGGNTFSSSSFISGMNARNIPAIYNFNSCKLIDSIHFYSLSTGSLVQ